jgi:signal transduction histidine kinase
MDGPGGNRERARAEVEVPVVSFETLAHNLRTPLTLVLGYLDVLLSGEVGEFSDEQRRCLEIVQEHAKRLSRVATEISFLAEQDPTDEL